MDKSGLPWHPLQPTNSGLTRQRLVQTHTHLPLCSSGAFAFISFTLPFGHRDCDPKASFSLSLLLSPHTPYLSSIYHVCIYLPIYLSSYALRFFLSSSLTITLGHHFTQPNLFALDQVFLSCLVINSD